MGQRITHTALYPLQITEEGAKKNVPDLNRDVFGLRQRKKSRRRRFRTDHIQKIARERMEILLDSVEHIAGGAPILKQRYADLARKIAMKSRTQLPRAWRYRICRGCKTVLQPGRNCRVRTRTRREKHVSVTCLECGWTTRYVTSGKKDKEA